MGVANAPRLNPNDRVDDRYDVIRLAREGGAAEVYEARDLKPGGTRKVALKVLKLEGPDSNALARIDREADLLLNMRHGNLIQALNKGRTPKGDFYITLEWLDGEDLADRLEASERLSSAEACRMGIGILRALAHIHEAGVVHRDVKPENIFLCQGQVPPDSVRLLDFGLAKAAAYAGEQLTTDGMIVGTMTYMAPEQVHGQLDARADLFACGLVLFECIAGQHPFEGESARETLLKIATLKEPPSLNTFLPGINPLIDEFLQKAIQPKPQNRFGSAREMELTLREIMEELGIA